MKNRRTHSRILLPIAVAFAVVLAGCFRIELAIEVNEDGSGTVTQLSAFDRETLETTVGAFGSEFGSWGSRPSGASDNGEASFDEQLDEFDADIDRLRDELDDVDLPYALDIESYDKDGFLGAQVSLEFPAGDDVVANIERASVAVEQALGDQLDTGVLDELGFELSGSDGSDSFFADFTLRREGEGWRFEMMDATSALGGDFSSEAAGFAGLFLRDATFDLSVKLPGRVTEHNADRIGGDGELIWEIDFGSDEPPPPLFALTVPGDPITGGDGGGNGAVIALVVAVVVFGVVLGGWYVLRQSRRPSQAG